LRDDPEVRNEHGDEDEEDLSIHYNAFPVVILFLEPSIQEAKLFFYLCSLQFHFQSSQQRNSKSRDPQAPHHDARKGNEISPESVGPLEAHYLEVLLHPCLSVGVLAIEALEHELDNVGVA